MSAPKALPDFVSPMLAKLGKAFDSPDYLYEIKWDGIRALSFIEGGEYRALSRRRNSLKERYPELEPLAGLSPGLVLDGELVVLREGKPDIHAVLRREQARNPRRVQALMREAPVTYIVFDLLYRDYEPVIDWVLTERRDALRGIVEAAAVPTMVFSEAIVGTGRALFEEATKNELEGIVAKRLKSRYLPGKRTDSWIKIKRRQHMYCAVLGFLEDADELRSLVVAVEEGGVLKYAGRVGSGLDAATRAELHRTLKACLRSDPLIPVPRAAGPALWVEPGVYCTVSFLERTAKGEFRAPVFEGLVRES